MLIKDIEQAYKNAYHFSKETGMSHNSWNNWRKLGYIPILTQLRLERLTNGEFKADLKHTRE